MDPITQSTEPSTPAPAAEPSLQETIASFKGEVLDTYRMHGLDEAIALRDKKPSSDVTPESSPGTTSETPATEVKSEAASEPAVEEEQTPPNETPEQKSERKHRNDMRRLRDLGKVTAELATERTKRELLEQQLAEMKAASAPVKTPEPKPVANADDRPEFPDIDKYEELSQFQAAVKEWQKNDTAWVKDQFAKTLQAENHTRTQTEAQKTWEQQIESEAAVVKDFKEVAFSKDVQASDMMIREMQRHQQGAKIAYWLGKNPKEAERITKITDVPANWALMSEGEKGRFIGKAEAILEHEYSKIAAAIKTPAPKQTTAAQLPKPSGEVSVETKGAPVLDELEDAIARKDVVAYKRIMNKRELQEMGANQ